MPRPRNRWTAAAVLAASMAVMAVCVPAAAASGPATISLVGHIDAEGQAHLLAGVTDAAGEPLAGARISIRAKTAFGWLLLAEVETDAGGNATVNLPPGASYPEVWAQSEDTPEVRAVLLRPRGEAAPPERRPGRAVLRGVSPQPGLISPYPPVQILVVVGILGGIWMTYAYLISLLVRIRAGG